MKSRGAWTPEQIDSLFEGLGSQTARVKYGAAKALKMVSEQTPVLAFVTRQLDNPRPATRKKAERSVKC